MKQAPRSGERLLPITDAERQARVRLAARHSTMNFRLRSMSRLPTNVTVALPL